MINWINQKWDDFEAWVHSWFPGFKTRILTALGSISMTASLVQQYITGLPATKWISAEVLQGTAAVLFTLSFWFSNMGTRVEARENA